MEGQHHFSPEWHDKLDASKRSSIQKWKNVLLTEALERLEPERRKIESALTSIGRNPAGAADVEAAIRWLLTQPIK